MDRRNNRRVAFEHTRGAIIVALDGAWRRPCTLNDISNTGAKLTVEGSIDGLAIKEFFLLLSSTGLAYRRCELAWVNGQELGVIFLVSASRPNPKSRGKNHNAAETRETGALDRDPQKRAPVTVLDA